LVFYEFCVLKKENITTWFVFFKEQGRIKIHENEEYLLVRCLRAKQYDLAGALKQVENLEISDSKIYISQNN